MWHIPCDFFKILKVAQIRLSSFFGKNAKANFWGFISILNQYIYNDPCYTFLVFVDLNRPASMTQNIKFGFLISIRDLDRKALLGSSNGKYGIGNFL